MRWALCLLALVAMVHLMDAGAFQPLQALNFLHRARRGAVDLKPDQMTDDELFDVFFTDPTYLLTPGEMNPPDDDSDEYDHDDPDDHDDEPDDDDYETRRSLVPRGDEEEEDDYEDEDYYDDYEEGRALAPRTVWGTVGKVIKAIGKVGLNMLKKGIQFLKSTFYKFGGKRLLKRAREYLKKNAFSIEPINCVNTTCSSCAVFTLPFKIKQFKACAKLGFKRQKDGTNFTVAFTVVNTNLFHQDFPVGDIANCFGVPEDPNSSANDLAALIGKVCVQSFEFKVETKKTGKFCLVLVFKRWAVGYRFCVERKVKEKGGDKKEGSKFGQLAGQAAGMLKKHRNNANKNSNETQRTTSKMRDTKNAKKVWKVELKKIAAGEEENQIVSNTTLFKGEAKKRQKDAEELLSRLKEQEQKS